MGMLLKKKVNHFFIKIYFVDDGIDYFSSSVLSNNTGDGVVTDTVSSKKEEV
jgi:hypothetical protein